MGNSRRTGSIFEKKACDFLRSEGYQIVERNYRCKYGEIDIIAVHEGYLCFIEVKYRKDNLNGHPLEAVTVKKQKKITFTSMYYMMEHHMTQETPVRYDVVSVCGDEIRLVTNAFSFQ